MKNRPVSIIIPAFNEEERLDRLLKYLKRTGEKHIREIIIADAGSSDSTIFIAEKHDVRIKHCEKRQDSSNE